MSDALCGRRFRTFNVVDRFNREVLAIEVDLNLLAERIIRVLERVAIWRGYPQRLRLDNGPELISLSLAEWAEPTPRIGLKCRGEVAVLAQLPRQR